MRAMVVTGAGQPLALQDRPLPEPNDVRIRVHACGVCHSDHFVTDGLWPGLQFPRVPGHEVAGVVDAIGSSVTTFSAGDRVGVGWHGGHDGTCWACLDGRFLDCGAAVITGIGRDGGYADYAVTPAVALAPIPEGLSFAHAAPILCAGVTTYNALRHANARPGDLVAIQGLGGLGHLGVQYARAMGFEVVALSRGEDKAALAQQLGAHHYVDTTSPSFVGKLHELGGARTILATAPSAEAITAAVPALRACGELIVVAAPHEPIQVGAVDLISGSKSIRGWASGSAVDSRDALAFTALHGIEPMVEPFALEDAPQALEHMMTGKARFRAVLDIAR